MRIIYSGEDIEKDIQKELNLPGFVLTDKDRINSLVLFSEKCNSVEKIINAETSDDKVLHFITDYTFSPLDLTGFDDCDTVLVDVTPGSKNQRKIIKGWKYPTENVMSLESLRSEMTSIIYLYIANEIPKIYNCKYVAFYIIDFRNKTLGIVINHANVPI